MDLDTDYIAWQDVYSVKSPMLDAQHQRFAAMLNDVYRGLEEEDERATLVLNLKRLYLYSITHFTFEEAILEFVGYPRLQHHREAHAEMRQKCQRLLTADPGDRRNLLELLHVLKHWWMTHTQGLDREYIPHIEHLEF